MLFLSCTTRLQSTAKLNLIWKSWGEKNMCKIPLSFTVPFNYSCSAFTITIHLFLILPILLLSSWCQCTDNTTYFYLNIMKMWQNKVIKHTVILQPVCETFMYGFHINSTILGMSAIVHWESFLLNVLGFKSHSCNMKTEVRIGVRRERNVNERTEQTLESISWILQFSPMSSTGTLSEF